MRGVVGIAAGTFALVASSAAGLEVSSLEVVQRSLEEHHTGFYKLTNGGFVVRRGQAFEVVLTLDEEIDVATAKVRMENKDTSLADPKFAVERVFKVGDKKYAVEVSTTVASPVGKFEQLDVSVQANQANATYRVPNPIYLIFNPWLQADAQVYIPTEKLRQEHILNEYGNVYQGSLKDWDSQKWHYGQSNQIALDATFHLLKKLEHPEDASDVIKVVRTMSHNQGMMRNKKTGGLLVGTEEALLEGNWGDFPFNDTNSPEIWTSSIDILNRWNQTKTPTQYGQCWVFGALENTLMRSVGVGSRQVTAFGAFMDFSMKHDKKKKAHHVIDEFYDMQGNMIHMDGQAWNFHSWTDIWLNRADNATLSGWQGLDGTPPGALGPAPVVATRALFEDAPMNISSFISTVHSTRRTFLVECDDKHKKGSKLEHCKVDKLMQYDHRGLQLMMTSASFSNGTLTDSNITADFIDPTTDAFIPYENEDKFIPWNKDYKEDDDSGAGRRLLRSDRRALKKSDDKKKKEDKQKKVDRMIEDAVSIQLEKYDYTVGENLQGTVELDTASLKQDELLQVNMMFTLENYRGDEVKKLESIQERVLVKGRKVVLPFVLDNSAYLQKDLEDMFIKIVVTGVTQDKKHFFDRLVVDIDSPAIGIQAPEKVLLMPVALGWKQEESAHFPVKVNYTNPLEFDLDSVCLSIHSHDLGFKDQESNVTAVQTCQPLKAGETIELDASIERPSKEGLYYVISQVRGDYLPYKQAHAEIQGVFSDATEQDVVVLTPQSESVLPAFTAEQIVLF